MSISLGEFGCCLQPFSDLPSHDGLCSSVVTAWGRFGVLLPALPDGSALAAFLPPIDPAAANSTSRCRAAVATTLVAGLELAHNGALRLDQGEAWAGISVHRPTSAPAAATEAATVG